MIPETITTALKEWAVVQRSLAEGHQIILVRKGGLVEETGEFDLRADRFLLFPTYAHETERAGDLQPCFNTWLWEEEERAPGRDEIQIEMMAQVTDVLRIEDRQKLLRFSAQHIWSAQFLNGRFDWEPYKPVFVLVLRAYRLPQAHILPQRPEYGGCRSWVTLAEPIPTEGSQPVLPDEHFARRRELTLKLLD